MLSKSVVASILSMAALTTTYVTTKYPSLAEDESSASFMSRKATTHSPGAPYATDKLSVVDQKGEDVQLEYLDNEWEEQHLEAMTNQTQTHNKTQSIKKRSSDDKDLGQRKVKAIHFIGERHSGTNWIFTHLQECFGDELPLERKMSRFKHWFQFDDPDSVHEDSLVIAQFRNSYEWVEALRLIAYHSPAHKGLTWKQFVTKPWAMKRFGADLQVAEDQKDERLCTERFKYNEVTPCLKENFWAVKPHPRYELRVDGSGLPYDSLVQLRRDKILNFLDTKNFENVLDTWVVRYEDFVSSGTEDLLRRIEKATGIPAKCKPIVPEKSSRRRRLSQPKDFLSFQNKDEKEEWENRHKTRKALDPKFIRWMNRHVDWEVEKLIGYEPWSTDEP